MREKILWALVIILAIGGVTMGIILYRQNVQMNEIVRILTSQNSQSQKTGETGLDQTPAPEAKLTVSEPVITPNSVVGREAFGSQISPDGKWQLKINDRGSVFSAADSLPGGVIEHDVVLKSLIGLIDKVIYTAREVADYGYAPVGGEDYASSWYGAGWSADGSKVYIITKAISDGCGGAYPDQTIAGDSLLEIDVTAGQKKVLMSAKSSGCGSGYGIHDVYASKNLVLFEEPVGSTSALKYNIYVSDLKGGAKKLISTVTGTDGVAADVFDPTGLRVALVTNKPSANGPDFTYKLQVVDIATKTVQNVDMSDSGNFFVGWSDADTIRLINSLGGFNDVIVK